MNFDRPKDWNVFKAGKSYRKRAYTRKDLGLSPSDKVLEEEVIKNGFERVLKTPKGIPLSKIVDEKLAHPRHKALIKFGQENPSWRDYRSGLELCYDEMLSGRFLVFFLKPRQHFLFF